MSASAKSGNNILVDVHTLEMKVKANRICNFDMYIKIYHFLKTKAIGANVKRIIPHARYYIILLALNLLLDICVLTD